MYTVHIPFDWDERNVERIARHGIRPEEVVLLDPLVLAIQLRTGEKRVKMVGPARSGRMLVVVLTGRRGKARVVTAYPAGGKLRAEYDDSGRS